MAIKPSNKLKLLAMRFSGHQSAEDYSNFEEEIANGIFDYLKDIMEDREDQLFEAFPEDGDAAEVSDEDEDSEDDITLEQFHYNRKQMYQIVEHRFVRKHKLATIQMHFKKVKHLKQIYRFVCLRNLVSLCC
ncbi:hypothetical protein L596_025128 [Steinernema carpocapsae]|uniref:Uncharacterized protein n=1 Tax=Steinernema carpocapsae TaxID=34508 RepID=A0A4U5M6W8_STECR|nr:hypothetical protein L596_025128 [Steinernema carpocapsae]